MKKLFTLLTLALFAIGTAWADGTVEKASNTGTKDQPIVGTSYTIAGTYIAGAGGTQVGDMKNKGIKLRTGSDGSRVVFTVNTGYVITDFKLYGISNYALAEGASEPCISVTKVEVDGTETTQTGSGEFPAKGSSTSGSVLLEGINATTSIAIYFNNENASGTQINAYYELTWEEAISSVPLQTVVTPESATISVGQKTTLEGEFSGGDFTGQWVSSDESVATVSDEGVVTGVAAGTANITYQWADNQSEDAYKDTAVITVIDAPLGTKVSPAAAVVAVGNDVTLAGGFTVGEFQGEWVSDDESVATVSDAGVVTGVAEGTANITFQWKDDQSEDAYKATAAVTVVDATFNKDLCTVVKTYDFANWGATTLTTGEKAGSIWNQANTQNNDVFWCTNEGLENLAIQAVLKDKKGFSINDNGLYEGSGAGRCAAIGGIKTGQFVEFNHNSETSFYTKSDKSDDGILKLACVTEEGHHVYYAAEDGMIGFELAKDHYVTSIVIYEAANLTGEPTKLSFDPEEVNAALGESFTAPTLTADPSDLTGIEYSSSNEKVATVDAETGEVTLEGLGTATITATFAGDDTYNPASASYKLNVTMAAIDSKTWDFSTWDDEENFDITKTTIIDGLQVAATESGKVGINSNVLKFGGTGAATHRHIRFRIAEGKHLITIVAKNGSGDANATARPLRMSFGTFGAEGLQEWSMTAGASPATLYYTYSGDETDVYIYSGQSGINLSSVSVSSADEVPVTVATDMATYVTPFNMDFSAIDGLKAYVVSEVTATTATLEEVGAVPAETPVILEGKGIFTVPVVSSASAPVNKLQAGSATMADGDYILKGGKFVRANAETVLPAGKAYITVPAGVREIEFVFSDATAISELKAADVDGAVYNLSGVRVKKAQKGVYILNGKKIVK